MAFFFSSLDILDGGMFSAATCNSAFAWFLIVMCNLVYVIQNYIEKKLADCLGKL